MRILVLSDLHANATALATALAAAKGRWEGVVCLGDVVGYRPNNPGKSRQSSRWADGDG